MFCIHKTHTFPLSLSLSLSSLIHTGQYHIPSIFFTPNSRLQSLIQAVEQASPQLVYTAELCGIHYTPQVRRNSVFWFCFQILYHYSLLETAGNTCIMWRVHYIYFLTRNTFSYLLIILPILSCSVPML